MTPARSRSPRRRLVCSLVAGALTLTASSARASTSVVVCTPSAGTNPILKLSPAAVPPPGVGKYGFKLKTTIDGCVANAQKLGDWVPSKNGSPDGASIAQAELSVSVAGYGNCAFGLGQISPTPPSAYDLVGTLKIKWLDADGDTIKSVKPSVAFLRMQQQVLGQTPVVTTVGDGTVSKGPGIGGRVRVTWPFAFSTGFDLNDPWTACLIGGVTVPPDFPPFPDPVPLKAIQLSGRPAITIYLPDLQ